MGRWMDGRLAGRTDAQTERDGWMGAWMDGRTDGCKDGWMDRQTFGRELRVFGN